MEFVREGDELVVQRLDRLARSVLDLQLIVKQLDEKGLEYLYSAVLNTALKLGAVEAKNLAHVCVDSTVMEKNIAYPTDSNLLLKVLQKMVQFMQDNQLNVRQTYAREAPRLAQKIGRYAHAKQFKRMRSALKKLSTRVGRVMRE